MVSLLPERGFVHDYVTTYIHRNGNGPVTDGPLTFHVAAAYTLLGAALMDRVRIAWAGAERPVNVLTLFLAPSTLCRKTTAVDLAGGVFTANEELDYYLGPHESSAEGTLVALEERQSLLFLYREMGDFLLTAHKWNERGKALLMDLADAPLRYWKRLTRQQWTIERPLVSVLAALNLSLMNQIRGTELDWHSGFFARFLLVVPGEADGAVSLEWRPAAPIKRPPAVDVAARKALGEHLQAMRARVAKNGGPGAVLVFEGMAPGAEAVFDAWSDRLATLEHDSDTPASFDRLRLYAVKLAALLTADWTWGETRAIEEEAMVYATRFCSMAADSLRAVAGDRLLSVDEEEMRRLLRRIREGGPAGVDHSWLLRRAHMKARAFAELLNTLQDREEVVKVSDERTRYVAATFVDAVR